MGWIGLGWAGQASQHRPYNAFSVPQKVYHNIGLLFFLDNKWGKEKIKNNNAPLKACKARAESSENPFAKA